MQVVRDELNEARLALEREVTTAAGLRSELEHANERIVALEECRMDGAELAEALAAKVEPVVERKAYWLGRFSISSFHDNAQRLCGKELP